MVGAEAVGEVAAAGAEVAVTDDRFGLSWRGELAAGILSQLDRIDCLEVIADDYLEAGRAKLDGLVTLARQVPVSLHSIYLGTSSTEGIPERRLAGVARLVERVRPEGWSEHLAFVRGGGREIGHLAPQSRTSATVDATLVNLALMERVTGLAPAIENIATLVAPPGSSLSEEAWLGAILAGGGNPLLLDLHNVYTNARNFGFDAREFLECMPLDRVSTVHLAGGRLWEGRWLDDHKHPVPDPVFGLLAFVAARAPQRLTVILERDGAFAGVGPLLAELAAARAAVARGRACPVEFKQRFSGAVSESTGVADQAALAEAYLSGRLDGVAGADGAGLALAARSFAQKRDQALTGSPSSRRLGFPRLRW